MEAIHVNGIPRELKTPARLLLLVLASHADNKTGESFPSQVTLARECGMTVRTVQRSLKILVDAGLLTVTRRTIENDYGDVINMTNVYKVLTPKLPGRPKVTKDYFQMSFEEKLLDQTWAEGL